MDVRIVDLIAADFVVVGVELLNSPQSIQLFGNTFDEFRWMPVTQAQNGFGDGKRISLDRDRIYIDLISGRSRVRQEFTSREKLPDLAKLTSRAIQFTDNCPSTAEAFGFNVEVSYDSTQGESAFSYIGRTMFSGLRKIDSWNLIGGLAAVRFSDDDGVVRNIQIEPRFRNDTFHRIYLHCNIHFERRNLPGVSEIEAGLVRALDDANRFIQNLEEAM